MDYNRDLYNSFFVKFTDSLEKSSRYGVKTLLFPPNGSFQSFKSSIDMNNIFGLSIFLLRHETNNSEKKKKFFIYLN